MSKEFYDNDESGCVDEDINWDQVEVLQKYIEEIEAIEDDGARKVAASQLHAALAGGEDGEYLAFRPS